ncbi:MAG: GreA/GreB family elongation factor [Hyalangium sp.]|uniref:GreA/GreB family elongation factor n=1 Tax=Hyalangium sp. TaxID=2028555 RepID=UPI00389AE29F
MSKAFTKEDSGGDEGLTPARPRSWQGEQRYITPEGYRAIQEELASLLGPDASAEGQPGLDAGVRKRERERRAQQLADTLEEVRVVTPESSQEGHVFFGAWVTLEDEEGAEVTYRIVGPDEADVKAGRLSVESPLAKALLGKEVGESVQVERPRGAMEYTVTQVAYSLPTH